MGTMSYRDQLLHPNWQRKRLGVLSRDGWICQRCISGDKTLHVHHKRYIKDRMVWEYEDSDLITLCTDCHQLSHEDREALLAEVSRAWYLERELAELVRGYATGSRGEPEGDENSVFLAGVMAARFMLLGLEDAKRVLALADRLFRIDAGLRVEPDA